MTYFTCPKTYKGKAYGCGKGFYNATQAFLDRSLTCSCGQVLRKVDYKRDTYLPKPLTRSQLKQLDTMGMEVF